MATAWCDGGPADGDRVDVDTDQFGLPPRYVRRAVMAFDEDAETVWWVGVRYTRAPFWKIPLPGEPWRFFHCPPTRIET